MGTYYSTHHPHREHIMAICRKPVNRGDAVGSAIFGCIAAGVGIFYGVQNLDHDHISYVGIIIIAVSCSIALMMLIRAATFWMDCCCRDQISTETRWVPPGTANSVTTVAGHGNPYGAAPASTLATAAP